ncbi:molecular chaperone [Shewanella pneumatophori]|uniref:Molecular chaperone n=1 Tax=Shewanella pneumatophori TaxID=314092 RepID=A0A9X1ZE96_9GAMM|nr:molecular chaperone [Shewanella pneumatophori]MCL1139976.1 molecular chaperone [Shewanella pneumatophori]
MSICLFSFINSAQASLLVSPIRVAFEGRERAHEIVLINSSSEVKTYRLAWQEKSALPSGGYKDLTAEEAVGYPSASKMLRFSPRQVTLKPNERQIVRLGLRRPKDLADGEYRSHLKLEALPPKRAKKPDGEMSINLDVLLSYSLPVIVRQGKANPKVEISSKELRFDQQSGKTLLNVNLTRTGEYSTAGNLVAYWLGEQGAEQVVARLNNVNIYPEVSQAVKSMAWIAKGFTPSNGQLRIVYEGQQEFNGQVFAEKEFAVTAEAFTNN